MYYLLSLLVHLGTGIVSSVVVISLDLHKAIGPGSDMSETERL